MAQKTVGHVELEWTCKRCGTKNPGLQKTCLSCGAPMAAQDSFELPQQNTLITDEAKLAAAEAGEDIHCPYCGARNPAGAKTCIQCSGDLTTGKARESGGVLGAYQPQPAAEIICPACGTSNPAGAPRCQNCGGSLVQTPLPAAIPVAASASKQPVNKTWIVLGAIAGVLFLAGLFYLISLGTRRQDVRAVVSGVNWQRSVQVLEERLMDHAAWQDQVPSGAITAGCEDRVRSTQPDPAPGAEEVCGEPYTVDEGNGLGRVVQDCEYRIHDNWCSYKINEWQVTTTHRSQGWDINPQWPAFVLFVGQREGQRVEDYTVTFQGEDNRSYSYEPRDATQFAQFNVGSTWLLQVNGLGSIVDVSIP